VPGHVSHVRRARRSSVERGRGVRSDRKLKIYSSKLSFDSLINEKRENE